MGYLGVRISVRLQAPYQTAVHLLDRSNSVVGVRARVLAVLAPDPISAALRARVLIDTDYSIAADQSLHGESRLVLSWDRAFREWQSPEDIKCARNEFSSKTGNRPSP